MKKTLAELIEERSQTLAAADAVAAKAKAESRDLTEDEERSIDGHLAAISGLDIDIKRKEAGELRQQRLDEFRGQNGGSNPPRNPIPDTRSVSPDDPVEFPDPTKYSLYRAVKRLVAGKELDGYEGEINQEITKRSDRAPTGFFLPMNLPADKRAWQRARSERRAFDTTAGAGLIQTTLSPTLIDNLRNRARLLSMGVTVLTGLVGPVDIPKKTGSLTAYWVGEATDVTGSAMATGHVELRPFTLGAFTDVTRRMLNQTSYDVEKMSLDDLLLTLALAFDLAGINGTGPDDDMPLGILQNSDVPTIAIGTNGGAMTWPKVVSITNNPAIENAETGTMGWLTNAKVCGSMQTIQKYSGTNGVSLWENNQVNGYRAVVSNQVPSNLTKGTTSGTCSAAIFGDFSPLVAGFWTGVDINVDTVTLGRSGGVRLIGLQDCGMVDRQPKSRSKSVDIVTT